MVAERSNDRARQRRLTSNADYDDFPAWSPDGTQIAFASDRDSGDSSRLEIYVMRADGSDVRRLTFDEADDRHPAWSPDGSSIALTTNRDGNREIYVMDASGGSVTRVTDSPGAGDHPDWFVISAARPASNCLPGVSLDVLDGSFVTASSPQDAVSRVTVEYSLPIWPSDAPFLTFFAQWKPGIRSERSDGTIKTGTAWSPSPIVELETPSGIGSSGITNSRSWAWGRARAYAWAAL